jgi:hypothetical protein
MLMWNEEIKVEVNREYLCFLLALGRKVNGDILAGTYWSWPQADHGSLAHQGCAFPVATGETNTFPAALMGQIAVKINSIQ